MARWNSDRYLRYGLGVTTTSVGEIVALSNKVNFGGGGMSTSPSAKVKKGAKITSRKRNDMKTDHG